MSLLRAFTVRIGWGALLGALILGVGGRIVMRWIALATNAPSGFTVGGTMTVLASGALSGAGGVLLYIAAHAVARRFAARRPWVAHLLFGILLALITWRGLRGTLSAPALAFLPLVACYAVALSWVLVRRERDASRASPPSVDRSARNLAR